VPWWSFSKTILATAALALVDQRKLFLDEPVGEAPYTLRQLLHHTSGLTDYGGIREYHQAVDAGELPWAINELLRRADASRLRTRPGERYRYSNIGYLIVRLAIERTTDSDLDAALRALVFDPLGLSGVRVAMTVPDFDAIVWGNARRYDPRWVYHGCVIGSLDAAASCLHRVLYGDLLSPESKQAMLRTVPYDHDSGAPANARYGLGLMIEDLDGGDRLAGHAGGGPGSTIVVFSAMKAGRTLAAAVDDDAPGTFPRLLDAIKRAGVLAV
jgi:CubicO group peptidase (beta-lactamase class C family)